MIWRSEFLNVLCFYQHCLFATKVCNFQGIERFLLAPSHGAHNEPIYYASHWDNISATDRFDR